MAGIYQIAQIANTSVPNAASGTFNLFLDTDGIWKKKNDIGVVSAVDSGAGQTKVSSADTTPAFLEDKLQGTANKITITKINAGGNEALVFNIGPNVFDIVSNTSDDITQGLTKLFVDATEKGLIASALQSGDNISALVNDAGYLTSISGKLHSSLNLDDGANPHGATAADINMASSSQSIQNKIVTMQNEIDSNTTNKRDKTAIKNSIEDDSGDLQLVGDQSAPGNEQYYGTDASGTKGFHALPNTSQSYFKAEVEVTTASNNFNSNTPTNVPDMTYTITQAGDYVFYAIVNCNNDENEELDMYFAKNGTTITNSVVTDRQQKDQDQSIQGTYPIDGLVIGDVITVQFDTRGDNVDLATRRMLIQSWG